MLTVLAFIVTMGLLVTVHEYGHFQVAKWCGVKVLTFSIGFGKPLWRKTFGADNTALVIAAIPLGGYVKMLDEREFASESDADLLSQQAAYSEAELARAFNRQSVAKRIAIVLAGPIANLLLAIVLYWLLFMMGVVGVKPIVGKVTAGSPAAAASFADGETIQTINGKKVATWQEASWILLNESLKSDSVTVEAVNDAHQIHVHQLDVAIMRQEEGNRDILTALGLTPFQPNMPAVVGEIAQNSPAALAGFKAQDLVLSISKNNVISPINHWEAFVQAIRENPNTPLEVEIQRGEIILKLPVTPEQVTENGEIVGRIGAALNLSQPTGNQLLTTSHDSAFSALLKATEKTWDISIFTLKMFGRMLTGQASLKGISGPVTIANYAGQSANIGLKAFISFLAVISISLGVLNLLPIPVLDGGHLMYYIVEIFTGKSTSETVMVIGQKIGLTLLGGMMILAFYNDINKWITG